MDCKGYQELITGSVDGELTSEETSFLEAHLKSCPTCKEEFTVEASLKTFIHERLHSHEAPSSVVRVISEGISQESRKKGVSWVEGIRGIFSLPPVRPVVAIAVTAILAIVFLTGNPTQNIIDKSVSNYDAVVDGSTKMHFASGSPALLREFFEQSSDFPVIVPDMDDCTLLGGVLESNPNGAFAEVVYDHNQETIYLYQTSWENAVSGGSVSVTPEARDALLLANFYSMYTPEGHTVVLWRKGETLCSAVSSLNEGDLIKCLTSGDPHMMQM